MSEYVDHNCGLVVAHTLHDAYSMIQDLQHRGRDAAGIAAIGDGRIDVLKWAGSVRSFDLKDLHKLFPGSQYHTFMAHVRYATRGKKDQMLQDAHPHTIGGTIEDHGSHLFVHDCDIAGVHNGQVEEEYFSGIDAGSLRTGCDTEKLLHFYSKFGEASLLTTIPGAYTLAVADKRRPEVIVLRDRTGIKPGVLGIKDGKYLVTSEDIAFRKNGGELVSDLELGTAYYFDHSGNYRKMNFSSAQPKHCFFEFNYIGDVDSVLEGINVRRVRSMLGERTADEIKLNHIDLVSYVPRCPEVAAQSFAARKGIDFFPIFYKMRGERSFQGADRDERTQSINDNLHLLPRMKERLKGKKVVIIDDSIVRGTVLQRVRHLLYDEAKVREAHIVSYTPPIGIIPDDGIPRGCKFGVDMPPNDSFLARGRTLEQISTDAGIDVQYMSLDGMRDVFGRAGIPDDNLCTFCIGGKHPFSP